MQLRNREHRVLRRQLPRRLPHVVRTSLITPSPPPMSSQLRGRCRVQVVAVLVLALEPKVAREVRRTRVDVLVVRVDALPTTAVTAAARTVVPAVSPPLQPCHAILVLLRRRLLQLAAVAVAVADSAAVAVVPQDKRVPVMDLAMGVSVVVVEAVAVVLQGLLVVRVPHLVVERSRSDRRSKSMKQCRRPQWAVCGFPREMAKLCAFPAVLPSLTLQRRSMPIRHLWYRCCSTSVRW